jgi:hypothetical protein
MAKTVAIWIDGHECASLSEGEDFLSLQAGALQYRVREVKKLGITWFRHEGHVVSLVEPPERKPDPPQLMTPHGAIDELAESLELVRAEQEEYRLNSQSIKSQLSELLVASREVGKALEAMKSLIIELGGKA